MTESEKLNLAFCLGKAYRTAESECKDVLLYLDMAMELLARESTAQGYDINGKALK